MAPKFDLLSDFKTRSKLIAASAASLAIAATSLAASTIRAAAAAEEAAAIAATALTTALERSHFLHHLDVAAHRAAHAFFGRIVLVRGRCRRRRSYCEPEAPVVLTFTLLRIDVSAL